MNNLEVTLLLEQRQKQSLSPKLAPSMNLLQMSFYELDEYIDRIIETNPVAERIETNSTKENDKKKYDLLDSLNIDDRRETLKEYVYKQLLHDINNPKEERIIDYILDSLDSNGFFSDDIEKSTVVLGCNKAEFTKCLAKIQQCEPAGVGAIDIKECVLIQLRKMENSDNAIKIVNTHLYDLAKKHFNKIAEDLHLSKEDVEEAMDMILQCNPRPANGFPGKERTQYIIPEVFVSNTNNGLKITINSKLKEKLSINYSYLDLYKKTNDKETKAFLEDKIKEINNLNYYINRRSYSVKKVSEYIIKRQNDYFITGDKKRIKPLLQQEIANDLDLSKSTVSRCVKNKYIDCDYGIFPMSFFIQKIKNMNKTQFQVKGLIDELIAHENPKKPLSDQAIAHRLSLFGVNISRRTVAKYRKESGHSSMNTSKKSNM